MSVVWVAGQRLGVQHELTSVGAGVSAIDAVDRVGPTTSMPTLAAPILESPDQLLAVQRTFGATGQLITKLL
jgi:hypothetical protein